MDESYEKPRKCRWMNVLYRESPALGYRHDAFAYEKNIAINEVRLNIQFYDVAHRVVFGNNMGFDR